MLSSHSPALAVGDEGHASPKKESKFIFFLLVSWILFDVHNFFVPKYSWFVLDALCISLPSWNVIWCNWIVRKLFMTCYMNNFVQSSSNHFAKSGTILSLAGTIYHKPETFSREHVQIHIKIFHLGKNNLFKNII